MTSTAAGSYGPGCAGEKIGPSLRKGRHELDESAGDRVSRLTLGGRQQRVVLALDAERPGAVVELRTIRAHGDERRADVGDARLAVVRRFGEEAGEHRRPRAPPRSRPARARTSRPRASRAPRRPPGRRRYRRRRAGSRAGRRRSRRSARRRRCPDWTSTSRSRGPVACSTAGPPPEPAPRWRAAARSMPRRRSLRPRARSRQRARPRASTCLLRPNEAVSGSRTSAPTALCAPGQHSGPARPVDPGPGAEARRRRDAGGVDDEHPDVARLVEVCLRNHVEPGREEHVGADLVEVALVVGRRTGRSG